LDSVDSRGGRGWRLKQARPVGEKEREIIIDGMAGGVKGRAKEGERQSPLFYI